MAKKKAKKTNKKKVAKPVEDDFEESEEDIAEDELDENEEYTGDAEFNDSEDVVVPVAGFSKTRSNGLFNNPWWKKGLLKGFIVWLLFVVFFYLIDFIGLIEVIDAKRWFFFLIFWLIIGMAWEKYLHNYIKI